LLRASFSAPKLLHTLRSAPCAGHPALTRFDNLLRTGLCSITSSNLSDTQWTQASLPVKDGGPGVRRVASLTPSAFLASAAYTLELQDKILSSCSAPSDSIVDTSRAAWSAAHNQPCPPVPASSKQVSWDNPSISADKATVWANAPDNHHRAILLASSAPHSGDWLHALPISSCGLRLDNESIRVAVGLRLGLNLCEPHPCPCGALVDARGNHGLACKRSAGRIPRHHNINDLVCRALSRANIPTSKEPSGLSRTDGKSPNGLILIPWQGAKP
jgi:hypothetical protein